MKMILMGTGTSHGIPVIGCGCRVCTSPFKKDRRLRCSAYIEQEGNTAVDSEGNHFPTTNVLIDCGPEFRLQAIRYGLKRLDAVLLTHSHADHLHGIDDLRIFSYIKISHGRGLAEHQAEIIKSSPEALPIYTNKSTIRDISHRFDYIFAPPKIGGGIPKIKLVDDSAFSEKNPLQTGSLDIIPVILKHGYAEDSGWIVSCYARDGSKHSIAYLTDLNFMAEESLERIRKATGDGESLDHLVIDGLRVKPHDTHVTFLEALGYADKIGARHTWITHINHDFRHTEINAYLKKQLSRFPRLQAIVKKGGTVAAAYDGLVLKAGE